MWTEASSAWVLVLRRLLIVTKVKGVLDVICKSAMPADQTIGSIRILQALPPYAKAVLCVAVSLMGVDVRQPVTFPPNGSYNTRLHQNLHAGPSCCLQYDVAHAFKTFAYVTLA